MSMYEYWFSGLSLPQINKINRSSIPAVGLLVVVSLLGGCGKMQLTRYEAQPVNQYPESQVNHGFAVAVRPLTDKNEILMYFGTDLLSTGILPVFVVVENQASDSSVLVSTEKFFLGASGESGNLQNITNSEKRLPKDGDSVHTAGVVGVTAGTVTGGLLVPVGVAVVAAPIALVGAKMKSNAKEVKRNMVSQALQNQMVSPGGSTHGFVYFDLPNPDLILERWAIHFYARETGEQDRIYVFNF